MLVAALSMVGLIITSQDVNISSFSFITGLVLGGIVGSIFSYKYRKRQILLNRISMIINALLIGLSVYWLLNLPGGIDFPEKGIEPLFPLIAIVFLLLANINISKDERLVKSVDRLR